MKKIMKKRNGYTVRGLQKVLKSMDLKTSGNKAELIARLSRAKTKELFLEVDRNDNEAVPGTSSSKANKLLNISPLSEMDSSQVVTDMSDSVSNINQEDIQHYAENINNDINSRRERNRDRHTRLFDNELDRIKHENKIMKRDLNKAKQEILLLQQSVQQSSMTTQITSIVQITLTDIKHLLPEFDGKKTCYSIWEKQLNLIKQIYKLDENSTKLLLVSKLVGKAAEWFYSSTEHISFSVIQLLHHLKLIFHQPSKQKDLREKFELRMWNTSETFAEYFYQKTIMAREIAVDEDDMVEYLIGGIPNENVKLQASMQCFANKEQLFQALKNITL